MTSTAQHKLIGMSSNVKAKLLSYISIQYIRIRFFSEQIYIYMTLTVWEEVNKSRTCKIKEFLATIKDRNAHSSIRAETDVTLSM